MHMRVFAFSSLSALALTVVGCGGSGTGPTPTAPTAAPSVTGTTTTPFPWNDGAGVFIGESNLATFTVQNIGSEDMLVSAVNFSGGGGAITFNPGVSVSTSPDTPVTYPVTVAFNASLVVSLSCAPTSAVTYNATVEIKSNASNLPDISVVVQCLGVTPTP